MQFVGVASQDDVQAMEQFIDRTGVEGFPNVNDESGDVWARYGVTYQPTFVFIAADGSTERFGALGQERIQQTIDDLFDS